MTNRRPLIHGLNENSDISKAEEDFVFGAKGKNKKSKPVEEDKPSVMPSMAGRVPITIRVRPEIGSALKRASLQRQLDGAEPSSMQGIVDQALESWLDTHRLLD